MNVGDREIRRLNLGERLRFGRGLTVYRRKSEVFDWNFQSRVDGKVIKLTIGQYPDIPIDEALTTAIEWKKHCKAGIHPRQLQKQILAERRQKLKEEETSKLTLRQIWIKYEQRNQLKDKPNSERTIKDREHTLEKHYANLLDKPLAEISSEMLLDKFNTIAGQGGSKSVATKSFRYLNPIFNFAIRSLQIIDKNPLEPNKDLIKISTPKNLNRLTIKETQKLFEIISNLNTSAFKPDNENTLLANKITPSIKLQCDIICLLLLTGLRQQEIIKIEIDQVVLTAHQIRYMEADGPYFRIIRSKQGQPMGIPITPPMASIFERRINAARQIGSKYVFPSPRPNGEDRPIAKERGAYPILKCLLGNLSESMNNSLNANVLRTTFASAAFELGITTDIVNAITGHFNSIHTLQKVATGAYVKTTAEGNRKWFNMINEKLLDQEIPFDAFYEEPAVHDEH